MASAEHISQLLDYLRGNESRFSPMTDEIKEVIIQSFLNGLENLEPDQGRSIEYKVLGLLPDIRRMTDDHPLRILLHDRTVEGIVYVLEDAGVVESARPRGLQRTRARLVEEDYPGSGVSLVGLTTAYLSEKGKEFDIVKRNTRGEKKETANELLNISSGIRSEFTRLGLVGGNEVGVPEVRPFESRPMVILQDLLRADTVREGLIGFTSLSKLMAKFWETQKYARIVGAWD